MAELAHRRLHLTSYQLIIGGFALVILLGALALCLPAAARDGAATPFGDALFTATSAVCVTGLVVRDTALHWSVFGQAVILVLIEIGGMGVITVAVAFTVLRRGNVSLSQRTTLQEALAAPQLGGVVRLTRFILRTSLALQAAGAAAMLPVFCRDYGPRGIWMAVFHSVSAFCNAGFDVLGSAEAPYVSLTRYAADPVINLTITALIVAGGIGFLSWADLRQNGLHWQRWRMQTKVVLTATGILILLPALWFFFAEFDHLPLRQRLLASLFQAVTPRTAGYNTVDLTALTGAGQSILIGLMLTGGSPGSTAGGMKTTTLAVLLADTAAVLRRRESASLFGRRLDDEAGRTAGAILLLYVLLFFGGALAICAIEELPVQYCMFETASAIGTVGLTLGLTPTLGTVSRVILMALMFLGRVGGLTLVYAVGAAPRRGLSRLPQEKIIVG